MNTGSQYYVQHADSFFFSIIIMVLTCQTCDFEGLNCVFCCSRFDGYHPIQERLAEHNGSQCGYCSPGFVMSMYRSVPLVSLMFFSVLITKNTKTPL